jgi:hypothetical protein
MLLPLWFKTALFTSIFNLMNKYFAGLFLGIFITYIFCVWFTTLADPEVYFWKTLGKNKIEYAEKLSSQGKPKIHFLGGSSCTFSIRPDILKAYGLDSVNMGMHAGMGALFNVGFGLSMVEQGDVIIIALEPGILCGLIEPTSLGINTAVAMGHKEWAVGDDLINRKLTYREQFNALRPGGRRIITNFFKWLLKIRPYRYKLDETDEAGWCRISYDLEQAHPVNNLNKKYDLGDQGIILLKAIAEYAESKSAHVYYIAPWQLTKPSAKEHYKALNQHYLNDISQIIPVLYDGYLGVSTNSEWYADTIWHLTTEGSRIRTEALAEVLIPQLVKDGWLKNQ